MRELAERLNSSQGKQSLLRGVKTQPKTRSTRIPATRPPVAEQAVPARESQMQPRVLAEDDLRRIIAEELRKQRQVPAQPTLREQDLRALIAQELARQTAPAPQPAEATQPTTSAASQAEQDLRALLAEELSKQSATAPLPQPSTPEPAEPTTTAARQAEEDLLALIARELERQKTNEPQPTLQLPEVHAPKVVKPGRQAEELRARIARELSKQGVTVPPEVEEPAAPTPAQPEPDLPTLIAQELERRRQQTAQPSQPEPIVQRPRAQESDLAALVAQELERRRQQAAQPTQPAPAARTPVTQEPDLPTLIAQELERRRQQRGPATSGVSPVTGLAPDNRAAIRGYRDIQAQRGLADEPWTLEADLDKYRAHAVAEGSRNSGESLKKAFKRIGLAIEDGTNIITLGYASDRGVPFRANDGKGLLQEPDNVPKRAGETIGSFGDGLYSIVDLVTFDALADKKTNVYQDNNPIVRPLIFTGRTINGVWKTTEELGNAITWGYFDNITGPIGMCFEDIIEVLKHAGQAVTNIVRAPVHMLAGKDKKADKALDWVLLVPLEWASNAIEMKGFSNMEDYENAFADKGVIGSILEFGGSTFIVYTAVDELIDELEDNNGNGKNSGQANAETPGETPAPAEPTTPPVVEPEVPTGPTQGNGFLYFAIR